MSTVVEEAMTVHHFGHIASSIVRAAEETGDLFLSGDVAAAADAAIDLFLTHEVLASHAGFEGARRVRAALAVFIADMRRGDCSSENASRIQDMMMRPGFAN